MNLISNINFYGSEPSQKQATILRRCVDFYGDGELSWEHILTR